MNFKTVFTLFLISCAFHVEGKSADKEESQSGPISEAVIRRELERYASVKKAAEAADLDITVIFSHTKTDEDDYIIQQDAVQFRSIASKHDANGAQIPDTIDEDKLQKTFDFATKLNMSSVASRETYSDDGSLESQIVYAEDIKLSWVDGHSDIIITDSQDSSDNEDQFESFVNMLKQYELPVTVQKTLYDDKGETLKFDTAEHKPRKVRIEKGNMQINKKLKVCEALKRAFSMKDDGNERVTLLCRYLGIEFPGFTWQAIIGDGTYFVYSSEWVRLTLEGQTYTVIANKKKH